ncbi:hypothetical protein J8273_7935 [Carpediemonas membranifera]|uniref:Uncharacterized protein n=1 Tax=Carpediemonas membranifera TaxID=201153 RepID=A0A8J6B0X7_9EUKA|nr:hypothetical protein J8273_7935 [Carpediemonas membranifera]|eukprot:KAG9390584.1 hypothetical protein J8273_7935 [Carpediemonas membranifera]
MELNMDSNSDMFPKIADTTKRNHASVEKDRDDHLDDLQLEYKRYNGPVLPSGISDSVKSERLMAHVIILEKEIDELRRQNRFLQIQRMTRPEPTIECTPVINTTVAATQTEPLATPVATVQPGVDAGLKMKKMKTKRAKMVMLFDPVNPDVLPTAADLQPLDLDKLWPDKTDVTRKAYVRLTNMFSLFMYDRYWPDLGAEDIQMRFARVRQMLCTDMATSASCINAYIDDRMMNQRIHKSTIRQERAILLMMCHALTGDNRSYRELIARVPFSEDELVGVNPRTRAPKLAPAAPPGQVDDAAVITAEGPVPAPVDDGLLPPPVAAAVTQ